MENNKRKKMSWWKVEEFERAIDDLRDKGYSEEEIIRYYYEQKSKEELGQMHNHQIEE